MSLTRGHRQHPDVGFLGVHTASLRRLTGQEPNLLAWGMLGRTGVWGGSWAQWGWKCQGLGAGYSRGQEGRGTQGSPTQRPQPQPGPWGEGVLANEQHLPMSGVWCPGPTWGHHHTAKLHTRQGLKSGQAWGPGAVTTGRFISLHL